MDGDGAAGHPSQAAIPLATAAADSGTGTALKPASSPGTGAASPSGNPAAVKTNTAGTETAKIPPKPVKATVAPKPQPAVEDTPH